MTYDPDADAKRLDMLRQMYHAVFKEDAPIDADAEELGEAVYEETRRNLAALLRSLERAGMGEAKKDALWQLGFAVSDPDPDPLKILICTDKLIRDSLAIAEREGKILLIPEVDPEE